ncbi:MAG: TorF family putative porin [Pseudomonadota bacterium]
MKTFILASAVMAAFAGSMAHAEDAPKPDNEIMFNAAVVSDYRYRGISQTRLQPALSGGADYVNNPSGFYAGTWLSTIKWVKDSGGDSQVEVDLYAGKRGEIVKDLSYDVGVLAYVYPSNGFGSIDGFANANTTEIYGQVGFGPAYIKYSHSVSNLFGFVDSKNSSYFDIGANIDTVAGVILNLHVGHQTVKNTSAASYTDYKVGVTKDFGFATVALAVIGTDTDSYVGPDAKNLGKTSAVLSISKTF